MPLFFIFIFCLTSTLSCADEPFFQSFKDLPIIGWFFEPKNETALRQAKTVAAAQALINNGALTHASMRQKQLLCQKLAFPNRAVGLITLYKNHGIDVTMCYDDNATLLMDLATHPCTTIITKADLALKGLCLEEIQKLLLIKNDNEQHIFDIIKLQQVQWDSSPERVAYLDAYQDFLIKKMCDHNDNCSICWDPLNAEKICTLTPCWHIFHQDCLRYTISTCPLCRHRLI